MCCPKTILSETGMNTCLYVGGPDCFAEIVTMDEAAELLKGNEIE